MKEVKNVRIGDSLYDIKDQESRVRSMACSILLPLVLNGITSNTEIIDNSEWIAVFTDLEEKILVGVRADGTSYYAFGSPSTLLQTLVDSYSK